ncbi:hypothetical protein [Agrococcus casei]|uniref:Uncharacterized protein n=1 Tax=Agrococcus casei LMG 22410 TaxID=1255656 RepID=A0A1R4GAZ8_9MICO|nr:hypothetical protein [Agrococcus casei]SJM65318.1 hypothetical protein CZ674_10410 [Agrococcus casei LMG 22410]
MAKQRQEHESSGFASLIGIVLGFVLLVGGIYLLGLATGAPEELKAITFVLGIFVFSAAFFIPMNVIGHFSKK